MSEFASPASAPVSHQVDSEIARLKAQLTASQHTVQPEWWSATNAMTVSASVLVFGLLICCIAAYLVKAGKSADSILKLFGTILIVISTLFLIVAGYSDKQIAPAIGLLGTVVGYLLGKDSKEKQ